MFYPENLVVRLGSRGGEWLLRYSGLETGSSWESWGVPIGSAEEGALSTHDWGPRSLLPVSWAMKWVIGAYQSLTMDPVSSLPSPVLQPLAP